jgi:hypothetical protein
MTAPSSRMSELTPKSLRPTPQLRPAQAAPVRRGQPAGGEGIPCGGVVGRGDGCAPAYYGWDLMDYWPFFRGNGDD